MIYYHGLPITPATAALTAIKGGHAFVSYAHPQQLGLAVEYCQSFAIDNGAFPAWQNGNPITDWRPFYKWATECLKYTNCDFVVIPDVIDGSELQNDFLVWDWPFGKHNGAPVWHMHESFERLDRLAHEWPRICIGSSGEYSQVGSKQWKDRMTAVMNLICDADGFPVCKVHGLRMLNPKVFTQLPLSSADSTNIGRNIGIDKNWKNGNYLPATKEGRAMIMRQRIEHNPGAVRWNGVIQ